MKILILDIETAPKLAYVWRFFKENISPKQVKEHGHIMSFAAKWLGSEEVLYYENRETDDDALLSSLSQLMDEADAVVAHNGRDFDMKQIRARALVNGLKPLSPVKIIDTKIIAKKEFGFPSNSLEYLSKVLNLKNQKKSHAKFPGFELWQECLRGNPDAWAEMREYNIQDVLALEELYLLLRPWDTQHPNVTIYAEDNSQVACPKCGGFHLQRRGFAYTNVGKYQRFQCTDCGGWGRTRYSEVGKQPFHLVSQVN